MSRNAEKERGEGTLRCGKSSGAHASTDCYNDYLSVGIFWSKLDHLAAPYSTNVLLLLRRFTW